MRRRIITLAIAAILASGLLAGSALAQPTEPASGPTGGHQGARTSPLSPSTVSQRSGQLGNRAPGFAPVEGQSRAYLPSTAEVSPSSPGSARRPPEPVAPERAGARPAPAPDFQSGVDHRPPYPVPYPGDYGRTGPYPPGAGPSR